MPASRWRGGPACPGAPARRVFHARLPADERDHSAALIVARADVDPHGCGVRVPLTRADVDPNGCRIRVPLHGADLDPEPRRDSDGNPIAFRAPLIDADFGAGRPCRHAIAGTRPREWAGLGAAGRPRVRPPGSDPHVPSRHRPVPGR